MWKRSEGGGIWRAAFATEAEAEIERLMGADGVAGLDFRGGGDCRQAAGAADHGPSARQPPPTPTVPTSRVPNNPATAAGWARYAGRRPKTFTTALGEMELERAW